MKPRKNITYLLGAGASANALPTYNGIFERIFIFDKVFSSFKGYKPNSFILSSNFRLDFKYYGTPDNYARFLSRSELNEKEYNDFKSYITLFLMFEQFPFTIVGSRIPEEDLRGYYNEMLKYMHQGNSSNLGNTIKDYEAYYNSLHSAYDPRYLSFFNTIFEEDVNLSLPKNINILSWNYDHQIEFSISKLNMSDKIKNLSGLNKLNGTASFNSELINFKEFENPKKIEKIFNEIFDPQKADDINSKYKSDISFAWEPKNKEKIIESMEIIRKSDAIVIIGYSFPNFNRFIDREIYSKVDLAKSKIYVQDINAENIIKKLPGVKKGMDLKAFPYTEISEFLIPNEFWEEKSTVKISNIYG